MIRSSSRRLHAPQGPTVLAASLLDCVLDGCKQRAARANMEATEASAAAVLGHLSAGHGEMVQIDPGVFDMGSAPGEVDAWPPPAGSGNFCDASCKAGFPQSHAIDGYSDGFATLAPVGSFPADRRGLHDMAGNVWEWVEDAYANFDASQAVDPVVKGGEQRVVRGGSWSGGVASVLRIANRDNFEPTNRGDAAGFRCAKSL